jgi:hypothetical protein
MGANQGLLKSIILENKEKKNPTITDLKGQNPRPLW